MTAGPRLVVADDHVHFRDAIVNLLAVDGFEVVGQASDGDEALALVQSLTPDIALLDVQMPGPDAADLLASIRADSLATRTVFLSMHAPAALVAELEEGGAAGYVVKAISRRSLAAGLHAVLASEDMVTLIPRAVDAGKAAGLELSPREREVLTLMARSYSNKQIAAELYISEATVKRHITTIYSRLGVKSRVEALAKAMREGLIASLG